MTSADIHADTLVRIHCEAATEARDKAATIRDVMWQSRFTSSLLNWLDIYRQDEHRNQSIARAVWQVSRDYRTERGAA